MPAWKRLAGKARGLGVGLAGTGGLGGTTVAVAGRAVSVGTGVRGSTDAVVAASSAGGLAVTAGARGIGGMVGRAGSALQPASRRSKSPNPPASRRAGEKRVRIGRIIAS